MNKICGDLDPLKVIGRARGYSKNEIIQTLPRHSKYTPLLLKQVEIQSEVALRNSGTQFAKKIIKMMREISMEAYRAKQFTRTEINNRGVLYGVVMLKHKVIDLVLNYFHIRWPQCVICLYNEHTHSTTVINEKGQIHELDLSLEKTVDLVSNPRPVIPYFEDIQFLSEEIFEELYKSQFITERENKPFFKKMIPDHCFQLPGMRSGVEKRFRNKRLDDFY